MTAHDELRRQLAESVAARGGAPARGPRRRPRGSRRGLAAVVVAVALGGGVAGAAAQLLRGGDPGDGKQARALVQRASLEASAVPACAAAPVTFVDAAPVAQIAAVLPALAPPRAPVAPDVEALVRRHARGAVLRRTVRRVRFAAGERLLVFAIDAATLRVRADPAGCDRARREQLLELAPHDSAVRRRALAMLADAREHPASAQTLMILSLGRHGVRGTGIPVRAGRPLPTGVAFSGGSSAATVYGGIAVPGARTVRLATRLGARRPLRRTIAVRERLFAFTLPAGTGPVRLRQQAAGGRTLAAQTIRE